ncbi:hypothetical protein QMK17_22545 [Rhodococcus sp. G-MC3]|uniref:T3SS (YopN, CesT) and YbjN peptide-binding chaperone 1 n=1 Tax=Rhodococcus sp. G-MC3 TaxID=3046209 RepID=UPI0024BA7010|nr:hypothetical protein [Rhodococcus sp. G-MC3]MDJ0396106.1 hypothetical protein [Rhodococcus sp. G-MC3]
MFEIPNLDDVTEHDWRAFTTQLSDRLASSGPGFESSVVAKFAPKNSSRQEMMIRTTAAGGLVCASSGLSSPPPPWRRSDVDAIHLLEEDAPWVDRFVAKIVTEIRHAWNVPHPSFLVAPETESAQLSAGDFVTPATRTDESELVVSVKDALHATFDNAVESTDGSGSFTIEIAGTAVHIYVASSDEVRAHACIVERISGRTRAAELVADLNRRHPRLKFLLVEDRVHAAVSIDASPMVPQHVTSAVARLAAFVSTADDQFAEHLGGTLPSRHPVCVADDMIEVPADEDVPPQLMTLLEIDAESGGEVGVDDVVSVCGADREKIIRYQTFCAEQAQSWREYAREAVLRDEPGAEYEAEAVPWDRIVRALQLALRTVGFFDKA